LLKNIYSHVSKLKETHLYTHIVIEKILLLERQSMIELRMH
jgi:hypothetical protein